MQEIFLASPEVAQEFRDELTRIAYHPTESEITEELPEEALAVLNHYGWNRLSDTASVRTPVLSPHPRLSAKFDPNLTSNVFPQPK